jgi:hypothetical protein
LAYCFQEGPATVKKIEDFFYLGLEMESGRSDEEVRAAGQSSTRSEIGLSGMARICHALKREQDARSG